MDSLTQAALGAVMGELVLGRKTGWRGAAWGAFFGTLPDLDVIALPFLSAADGIHWHRGLSHSILIMILASLVLARPLANGLRSYSVTPREAGWMVFWAWSTHVLIDCFTTYGTQIFEPFSDYRFAMNIIFIVDPLFTIPLLVGLWLALRIHHDEERRKKVMCKALGLSSIYVLFSASMQTWARNEIQSHLDDDIPNGTLVAVAPSSFNTILWRGLIETQDGYFLSYWSPFDEGSATYKFIEKKRELMTEFEGTPELDALKWFSRGHWVARPGEDGAVKLIDMRFAEIRDPKSGMLQQIFQWPMTRDEDDKVHCPMVRPEGLDYAGATQLLWSRIWGNRQNWDALREF